MTGSTKVIQVTNIAPQATKDQMQTLFGTIGKIDEIRLYPTVRDVSCPVNSRICYVKYIESSSVAIAQHLTNTVFIDRALIVIPITNGVIPDEYRALEMSANGTLVPGLQKPNFKLPEEVVNRIDGLVPNQVVKTDDPKLVANNLPEYPALPVNFDARKIEETRRTIVVIDISSSWKLDEIMEYFKVAGEIKYARFAESGDGRRMAMIEFLEQRSVINALKLQGQEFEGRQLNIYHSTQPITKPEAKSNEAAQKEIEEAMSIVKEAQSMISAAIDPVIGLLAGDKSHTRSRSKSRRRSKTRDRSRSRDRRRRSRSRSRSRRHKSRSRRSRTRSRDRRKRSRSRDRRRRTRSGSRKRRSRSRDYRRRSRSRDRKRHRKDDRRHRTKSRTRSPKKVKRKDDRRRKSRSPSRSKSSRLHSPSVDRVSKRRSPSLPISKRRSPSPPSSKRHTPSDDRSSRRRSVSPSERSSKRRSPSPRTSKRRSPSPPSSKRRSPSLPSEKRRSASPERYVKESRRYKERNLPRISEERPVRDYDAEERIGREDASDRESPRRSPSADEKEDDMDISNSP